MASAIFVISGNVSSPPKATQLVFSLDQAMAENESSVDHHQTESSEEMVESNNIEAQPNHSNKTYFNKQLNNNIRVNLQNNSPAVLLDMVRKHKKGEKTKTMPSKAFHKTTRIIHTPQPSFVPNDRLLLVVCEIKLGDVQFCLVFTNNPAAVSLAVLLIVSVLIISCSAESRPCMELPSSQLEPNIDFYDTVRNSEIMVGYKEWLVSEAGRYLHIDADSGTNPLTSAEPKISKSKAIKELLAFFPEVYSKMPSVAPACSDKVSGFVDLSEMTSSKLGFSTKRYTLSHSFDSLSVTLEQRFFMRDLDDRASLQLKATPFLLPMSHEYPFYSLSPFDPFRVRDMCGLLEASPSTIKPLELGMGNKRQGQRPRQGDSGGGSAKRHCTTPTSSSRNASIGASGISSGSGGDENDDGDWRERKKRPKSAPPSTDKTPPSNSTLTRKKGSRKSRKRLERKKRRLPRRCIEALKQHKAYRMRGRIRHRYSSTKGLFSPLVLEPEYPPPKKKRSKCGSSAARSRKSLTHSLGNGNCLEGQLTKGEASSCHQSASDYTLSADNTRPPADDPQDCDEDYASQRRWAPHSVSTSKDVTEGSIPKGKLSPPPQTSPSGSSTSTRERPLVMQVPKPVVSCTDTKELSSRLPPKAPHTHSSSGDKAQTPHLVPGRFMPHTRFLENGHRSEENSIHPKAPGGVSADGRGSSHTSARERRVSWLIPGRSFADVVKSSVNKKSTGKGPPTKTPPPSTPTGNTDSACDGPVNSGEDHPPSIAAQGQSSLARKKQTQHSHQLLRANSCPCHVSEVSGDSGDQVSSIHKKPGSLRQRANSLPRETSKRPSVSQRVPKVENTHIGIDVSFQGSTVRKKPASQFHQTLGEQLAGPCPQPVTEPVVCGGSNSHGSSQSEDGSTLQETHSSSPSDERTETQSAGNASLHTLHSSIVNVNCLASTQNIPCDGGHRQQSTEPRPASPSSLVVPPVCREPVQGDTGSLHVAPLARPVPESFRLNNRHKLLLRTSSYTGEQDGLEEAVQVSDTGRVDVFCLLVNRRVFYFHRPVPQAEGDPIPVGGPLSPRPQAQLLPGPTSFPSAANSETEECLLANLHINGSGCFNTLAGTGSNLSPNELPRNVSSEGSAFVFPASAQYQRAYVERVRYI